MSDNYDKQITREIFTAVGKQYSTGDRYYMGYADGLQRAYEIITKRDFYTGNARKKTD